VKGKQIGAVGLHVSHGISMHGFSFNVNPDLSLFKVINLCGLPGAAATSIQNELGHPVSIEEVSQRLLAAFAEVFRTELAQISKEQLKKMCAVT
jgi:lipoyl(octanoyl) transferase